MSNYIRVEPIVIYPPCMKAGRAQDCFNCNVQKAGACPSPRGICVAEYKNHKRGCPNYGKRAYCPPYGPMFDKVFDMTKPFYAITSTHDLGAHVEKMRKRHPDWTDAQLLNVLYWQGQARKELRNIIAEFNEEYRRQGYYTTIAPEGMGVDVTQTLKNAGIHLEWPARQTVYKVAIAGIPIDETYMKILT